jgi:3-oxoacyl-[acyl-carrier protein] reductase
MTESLAPEAKEKYIQAIPMGNYGKSEDVANLTLFLLSSASRYITGEVIKVDGGLYI